MESQKDYFVPINTVAKELDVPAHTLRYWEKQFPGAIRPVTGAGNRRYYRRETIEKLRAIKSLLYDKGMTIVGVKKILHNGTLETEIKNAKTPVNTGNFLDDKADEKRDEISPLDMGDIDAAIKLLKLAKNFLD